VICGMSVDCLSRFRDIELSERPLVTFP